MLVVRVETDSDMNSVNIPDLAEKMQTAFPGILPDSEDCLEHSCGIGEAEHDFRREVERGTSLPHLLEHIILFLIGRSSGRCSGYTGQRSADLERGVQDLYYVVINYSDRLQALVATDVAYQVLRAWTEGRTVRLDREIILRDLEERVSEMLALN